VWQVYSAVLQNVQHICSVVAQFLWCFFNDFLAIWCQYLFDVLPQAVQISSSSYCSGNTWNLLARFSLYSVLVCGCFRRPTLYFRLFVAVPIQFFFSLSLSLASVIQCATNCIMVMKGSILIIRQSSIRTLTD